LTMAVAEDQCRVPPIEDGSPLAIVSGSGSLPYAVAEAAGKQGRRVVLFALQGAADAERVARCSHHWFRFGPVSHWSKRARREGCREVVFIGGLVRPAISHLWTDLTIVRHLPMLIRLLRGGDNKLLTGFARIVEAEGFRVSGAHEVAPEILMPK